MTFRRSSRKELMEFYPERAGAIINVKPFARVVDFGPRLRLAPLARQFLQPR